MNVFFYAAKENALCQDVMTRLKSFSQLHDLIILPCGSRLNSPEALRLRNGDLIFLFAEDNQDLDELISLSSDFEGFRIILLLKEWGLETVHRSHLLKPRYIVGVHEEWNELESIVDKIIFADCCQWLVSAM